MASSAARRRSVEPPTGVTGTFTGLVLQDTYTLGRRIGYGAVGEVYEAAHVRLPGRVAVKILRLHLLGDEAAFARFCREAEMMSAIQNPHVVQVLDFNQTPEGLPYFVMEYLDGVDLEVRLAYAGPLPLATVVRIVDGVASALSAAHAHGIVHRDLKPASIFLVREEGPEADFVKVVDFGVSSSVVSGLASAIDERADQFALAAIAHTMLTGAVHAPHARLAQWISWDKSEIQAVLDRALAKRPEDRFDGIVAFAQAFSGAAAGAGVAAAGAATQAAATVGAALTPPSQMDEEEEASYDPPPVRTFVEAEDATPKVQLRAARPATVRNLSAPLDFPEGVVPDLPRNLDRVPRMRRRAIAIAVVAMGVAGFLVYKGWRRGPGQLRPVPAAVELTPLAAPEIVPVEPAAPREEMAPPPAERAAPRVSERRARAPRGDGSRSVEQRSDVEAESPSPPKESEGESAPPRPIRDVPATESPAPKGFAIPEPAPLPPGRDLAPPPAPSE